MGLASDYVRERYMMLHQGAPVDYIIATGVQYGACDFIERNDPYYFRPAEVLIPLHHPSKPKAKLSWRLFGEICLGKW